MIRVLFIHQNLPGQFRRLMRYLQTRPDYQVVAIGEETAVRREPVGPALRVIGYPRPDGPGEKTHHYLRHFEGCVRRGQAVGFDPEYPVSLDDLLKPLAATAPAPAYAEEVA